MGFLADLSAKIRGERFMTRRAPAMDRAALAAEIAGLSRLAIDELRERWKTIYGTAPSREIGRSFLTRAIASRSRYWDKLFARSGDAPPLLPCSRGRRVP